MSSEKLAPLFLTPNVTLKEGKDNVTYLKSNHNLGKLPNSLLTYLEYWAKESPNSIFLGQRNKENPKQWDTITFAQILKQAKKIAASFNPATLSKNSPLMILSGNSIDSATLIFACYIKAIPVVNVSPSYSLMSKDFGKVKHIQNLVGAKVVFAESYQAYKAPLEMLKEKGLELLTADQIPQTEYTQTIKNLLVNHAPQIDTEHKITITPDTPAKIYFTSGSTGTPKGVVNTHGMLTSNQEAIAQIWPFIQQQGNILLDWLPWNHTFGGNHNFNMALRNGCTLYIDEGKPVSGSLIETTINNLHEISPTIYFNVATGYELLVGYLEKDEELAKKFFKSLRVIFFAAAALPESTWKRLQALINQYAKQPIPITSSWGLTEASPLCTSVYFDNTIPNNIGLPIPGTSLKLVPNGDLKELRVKGPNVMSGYLGDTEKNAAIFDNEGYLCSGDAVDFVDINKPELGLLFKGRVNENFKLQTGTWVNVSELRLAIISALSPLISDIVICGHNASYLSLLMFPNIEQCQLFIGENTHIFTNQVLKTEIIKRLNIHNSHNLGSSKQIKRALLQINPPSFDDNETTDKGYLNQLGLLRNRASDVQRLYQDKYDKDVILIE